jgi:hypothetical protein
VSWVWKPSSSYSSSVPQSIVGEKCWIEWRIFLVTCLLLWHIVLLIVVLEASEKTMCDLRFWLLRELGVEAQHQLEQLSSAERCW